MILDLSDVNDDVDVNVDSRPFFLILNYVEAQSDVIAKSLKFPLFYNIKVTNFTKKTNSAQEIIKTERCGVQKFLVLYFLRENKSLLISYELHIF